MRTTPHHPLCSLSIRASIHPTDRASGSHYTPTGCHVLRLFNSHPAVCCAAVSSASDLSRPACIHHRCVSPVVPRAAMSSTSVVASSASTATANRIALHGVIGFNGSVPRGVVLSGSGVDERLIFPLGSTVVLKQLSDNQQHFLSDGHDRDISALALSPCGRLLASGQLTHLGFVSTVCVWDLISRTLRHRWSTHKGKVQSLSFSADSSLLVSLGGRDDMKLVVWDLASGTALCGATAANDSCSTVRCLNRDSDRFVTAGAYNLRVWAVDRIGRKLTYVDCQLGQLKRLIADVSIADDDTTMYCATSTGDILTVDVNAALYKGAQPAKLLVQGASAVIIHRQSSALLVGTGDGSVVLLTPAGKVSKSAKVSGAVTSLVLNAAGDHFFCGTADSQLYLLSVAELECELRLTCHTGPVTAVAFPALSSALFATAAASDIRVWRTSSLVELLRIQVSGGTCQSLLFSPDGKSIVSGWLDGKVRAFTPQTGRPLYTIEDAHIGGVTALALSSDGRRLVSGGEGGHVRVWSVSTGGAHRLLASMKEHQQRVNSLVLSADDESAVSASNDGSCIVWSLTRFARVSCLLAPTQFKSVAYHPDFAQLLTSGSDRKLHYWDVAGAEAIRVMEAGGGVVNSVAVSGDGELFVSGGDDKTLRVWQYDSGVCEWQGVAHAAAISQVAISPDNQHIVTAGDEGAVMVWRMPDIAIERDGVRVERVNLRAVNAGPSKLSLQRDEEEKQQMAPARANKRHVLHVRK